MLADVLVGEDESLKFAFSIELRHSSTDIPIQRVRPVKGSAVPPVTQNRCIFQNINIRNIFISGNISSTDKTVSLRGFQKHLKRLDGWLPLQGECFFKKPTDDCLLSFYRTCQASARAALLLVPSGFVKINKCLHGNLGKWLASSCKSRPRQNVDSFLVL